VKRSFILLIFMSLQTLSWGQGSVHVLGWYGSIPQKVITQFEKETGIKVQFDAMDSNEMLEAKLLVGSSGYDVVFPSLWPFAARQISANLYQELDLSKLKNYPNILPTYLQRCASGDHGNKHLVPYTWGLVAIAYHEKILSKGIPGTYDQSWALLFDPVFVAKLAPLGVSLVDDAGEVFLSLMLYLGQTKPQNLNPKILKDLKEDLLKIRPFIKKFDSTLSTEHLISGELSIVQCWRDTMYQTLKKHNLLGKDHPYRIVLPKEGTIMWLDCMAIPKSAPNLENAYKFIDFLLRPDISAEITNSLFLATTVKNDKYLEPAIKKDPLIFPPKSYMKNVVMAEVKSLEIQNAMTRTFTKVVANK